MFLPSTHQLSVARVIPVQIVIFDADFGFYQDNYLLINPHIKKLLTRMADEPIEYSLHMHQLHESIL